MDYIRKCHVFLGTQCNCPEGACRRQQAEDEAALEKENIEATRIKLIEDLIDFQLFLKDEGYISNYDWSYEDAAEQFVNQR
jgi:hypothetical protein